MVKHRRSVLPTAETFRVENKNGITIAFSRQSGQSSECSNSLMIFTLALNLRDKLVVMKTH